MHLLLWVPLALVPSSLSASSWDDISVGLFNDARASFAKQADAAQGAEARQLRFGEAIALLNVQPRTQANIDNAYAIFEEVRVAAPADDLGIESRYLQGRIEQVHRSTPDLAKADAIFDALIQAYPDHPTAQRAMAKLAVIRLYSNIDAAERRRHYDEFSAAAQKLTEPGAIVQLQVVLADVARRMSYGDELELAHVLAADKTGVVKRSLQMQVVARIGDLARLTGRKELARTYYERFLEQFPRTNSRSTIEGYLAALN